MVALLDTHDCSPRTFQKPVNRRAHLPLRRNSLETAPQHQKPLRLTRLSLRPRVKPTNLFGFTGRELDAESDLQFSRARYYDAGIGQWISEDPIGFGAGDANIRRYVGNQVTVTVDPSGLNPPTPLPLARTLAGTSTGPQEPVGAINPNNPHIAVIVLTDVKDGKVGSPQKWRDLGATLRWGKHRFKVRILALGDEEILEELRGLPDNEARRKRVNQLIKNHVADEKNNGQNPCGTVYFIGHRGGEENEAGAVMHVFPTDLDDPDNKIIVIKGGKQTDATTVQLFRDLFDMGCTHANVYVCQADPDDKIGRAVRNERNQELADRTGMTIGASKESGSPLYPLGQDKEADTFSDAGEGLGEKGYLRLWPFDIFKPRKRK